MSRRPADPVALCAALVRLDSRNPALVPGAPGEAAVATYLAEVLDEWGFAVELREVGTSGRANVVARKGPRGGRSLMLNGHMDVVGTEGMLHAAFAAECREGRLYGRGSADMKAGLATMCVAASRAADDGLDGEIVIAAVADEEYESLGTRALLADGVRADAAIVAEPTRLAICPAHRGFAWLEVAVRGRAAHGSLYDVGIDAITHAGLLLTELYRLESELLPLATHRLLGRASLHASLIQGGTGLSTYPDLCTLSIERRTIPGETGEDVLREIQRACSAVRAVRPDFDATVTMATAQPPSDVAVDAPVVRALASALRAEGEVEMITGLSAWTDAALLNAAGVPAICFGPGDIALAHAAEEFVPVDEIERATRVMTRLVRSWCNGDAERPADTEWPS